MPLTTIVTIDGIALITIIIMATIIVGITQDITTDPILATIQAIGGFGSNFFISHIY